MRRNSILDIVVAFAALVALAPSVQPSEHNPFKKEAARIPQAAVTANGSPANTAPSVLDRASSTRLTFTHLSVADGLSNADVRAVAQDHQGFMWFGTWLGGLNRYDGYTFKVYKHDDRDPRSLNNDTVRTLFVDRSSGR